MHRKLNTILAAVLLYDAVTVPAGGKIARSTRLFAGAKESAVLDLKAANDLALFKRMLARADVLVQNLAPGAMDRLGLGDDLLRWDFPQLIAVSILGYGRDTDYARMKAYDLLVQAESGLCAVTGTPESPPRPACRLPMSPPAATRTQRCWKR